MSKFLTLHTFAPVEAPAVALGDGTGIPDVPDVSAQWYLDIVEAAGRTPHAVQLFAEIATDGVLAVLGLLFLSAWWRRRSGPADRLARTFSAPALVVIAYLISEAAKNIWQVDRPCNTLEVTPIAPCPEYGDWSLPSNHAAIAGAAAVGLCWLGRAFALSGIGIALLAAASRVFVGVHYPHDVIAGLLLGALIGLALPLLVRIVVPVVVRLRAVPGTRWLVGSPQVTGSARTVGRPDVHGRSDVGEPTRRT